jgi:hypothetical protein
MDTLPPDGVVPAGEQNSSPGTALVQAPVAAPPGPSLEEVIDGLKAELISQIQSAIAVDNSRRVDSAKLIGGLTQSEELDQLYGAMAAAQAELVNPDSNKVADVELKSGGSYTFKFANLAAGLAVVRPVFGRHGLMLTQVPTRAGGATFLVTRIGHKSGQWMQSVLPLPALGGRMQEWGGALTFMRRYVVFSMVGIAADTDDDDANAWDNNRATINDAGARRDDSPPPRQARARQQQQAPQQGDEAAAPREAKKAAPPPAKPADPLATATQAELKDFKARLAACVSVDDNAPDLAAITDTWAKHHDLLNRCSQVSLSHMVDWYRNRGWGNPPAVTLREGLAYPPGPVVNDAAA